MICLQLACKAQTSCSKRHFYKNDFRQYYNAADNTYDTGSKNNVTHVNGDTKDELPNTNAQLLSVRDYLLDLEERIYNADFGDAFEDDNERKLVSIFLLCNNSVT